MQGLLLRVVRSVLAVAILVRHNENNGGEKILTLSLENSNTVHARV